MKNFQLLWQVQEWCPFFFMRLQYFACNEWKCARRVSEKSRIRMLMPPILGYVYPFCLQLYQSNAYRVSWNKTIPTGSQIRRSRNCVLRDERKISARRNASNLQKLQIKLLLLLLHSNYNIWNDGMIVSTTTYKKKQRTCTYVLVTVRSSDNDVFLSALLSTKTIFLIRERTT